MVLRQKRVSRLNCTVGTCLEADLAPSSGIRCGVWTLWDGLMHEGVLARIEPGTVVLLSCPLLTAGKSQEESRALAGRIIA